MARAASELAHLFRALKAPAAARALPVLADRAREEARSYERFAEALLSTEVASRDSHGGEGRIKAPTPPPPKPAELNRPRGGVARRAQAATSSARRYAPSLRAQPLDPPTVVHFSTGAGGPLFNRP